MNLTNPASECVQQGLVALLQKGAMPQFADEDVQWVVSGWLGVPGEKDNQNRTVPLQDEVAAVRAPAA
ncbi:hypothetical protein [Brevundimonas nasdae]|uniref:Uncharacterized protein n=1 Tax=Brevundimonas nasdae TaxID=172043 RepID=A0ABX8TRD7_9CAUL|nr:hypothetical protein [Brevundimonas nasdae]QYC12344.1 hypothetical protein KWG56_01260 [Brevundimonas nasdae]QYC15958.1 hypothetical protein KWG63_14815 [Brevundimonas nasdae]